jgi:membrane-associated phospholipid phosphatase
LLRRLYKISNPYFAIPFLLWVLTGGIFWYLYSKKDLFAFFNTHHNPTSDTLMYNITWMGQAQIIVPVLLLVMALPRYRNWWYLLLALACNVAPFLIAQIIKSALDWPRPLNLYNHAPWIHISPDWPEFLSRSFPSGHSQAAFSMFCFLSLLLIPEYLGFGALFFVLAFSVAISRMYLAAHFFSDVYAGSILGTIVTIVVYDVMHYYRERYVNRKNQEKYPD